MCTAKIIELYIALLYSFSGRVLQIIFLSTIEFYTFLSTTFMCVLH